MADYYPLIARAIAGLDPSAPGESRRALYERARVALTTQLRKIDPPLSESKITRERLSLEEAVRKVESEAAQRARDAARAGAQRHDPGNNALPRVRSFRDIAADADDLGRAAAKAGRVARKTTADEDLAEMTQRLEEALRRPAGDAGDLGRAAAQASRVARKTTADENLAEMAQRLEAALRRPTEDASARQRVLDEEAARQRALDEEAARQRALDEEAVRQRALDEEAARQRALDEEAARQRALDEEAARQSARSNKSVLGEEKSDEKIRRPVSPPLNIIPEQDLRRAMGFNPTRTGPLDLVRDPPTDPYDPEQSLLYERIRRQVSKLKQDIPSQERSQVNDAIDDFLEQPAEWSSVENKKILWLSGNSLRALLAQSDSVRSDPEHYSKLPPSVAEGMRNPVQAWSIFVQGDPAMALLDKYSLGPQEQQSVLNNLAAVEGIVAKTVEDRNLLTMRAANAINATMKSASSASKDINTKLAQELADNTSKNLFSQILRRAYLLRDAIVDPDSPAAMELRQDLVKGAAQTAGGIALSAALAGGAHALPYFEFIANNPMIVKEYILVAFQNSQMGEIVDAIEFEYNRLRLLLGPRGMSESSP
jgi:hypothetical protein